MGISIIEWYWVTVPGCTQRTKEHGELHRAAWVDWMQACLVCLVKTWLDSWKGSINESNQWSERILQSQSEGERQKQGQDIRMRPGKDLRCWTSPFVSLVNHKGRLGAPCCLCHSNYRLNSRTSDRGRFSRGLKRHGESSICSWLAPSGYIL